MAEPLTPAPRSEDDANADWLITLQKLHKAQTGTPTDAELAQAARRAWFPQTNPKLPELTDV